jgi:hypothetical protein
LFAEIFIAIYCPNAYLIRELPLDIYHLHGTVMLKMPWDHQFTSEMEGMDSDLAVGADTKGGFDSIFTMQGSKLDFSVQVLTAGSLRK